MTTEERGASGAEGLVVRATAEAHFAWLRTRLALENTLMAWVRTGISLIGFGFAVVEIFNRLAGTPGMKPARYPQIPRLLGLMLIGAGVLALLVSSWQYVSVIKYLRSPQFRPIAGPRDGRGSTPALVIAIGLTLVGLFAFFTVLLRVA